MIVVDTNIIASLFLQNTQAAQASQVLRKDQIWAAPQLWRSEFRNVLVLYLRKKLLAREEAEGLMNDALALIGTHEYEIESSQVLNMAVQSTCSAYDCEFVALAKDLGVPLVTVDKQILQQFPEVAVSLEQFLAS